MDCQEVFAEKALLLVTEHLGLQHDFLARRARHDEGRGVPG